MSANQLPQSTDDYSWLAVLAFCVLAVVAALLALTSAGCAAAATTILLHYFSGRQSWAIAILIIAVLIIVPTVANGNCVEFLSSLAHKYRQAGTASDLLPAVMSVWSEGLFNKTTWAVTAPFGAALTASAILLAEDRRNSPQSQVTTGSARPRRSAPLALLLRWWVSHRSPGAKLHHTIIGTELRTGRVVTISDTSSNRHTLVVGSVGRGKTVSLFNLLESAVQRGTPVTYVDGKAQREIIPYLRALAEKYGRKFYYWSAADIEQSNCAYDPLATGDFTSKADRIMQLRQWTEPHYESLAAGFIQTVIKVCERTGHHGGLLEIADLLSVDVLLRLLRRSGFSSHAKQALANEILEQKEAERSAISSLRRDLKNIADSALVRLFDVRSAERDGRLVLRLRQAREERALVYIGLPGLSLPRTAPIIAGLVTSDVKATASTSNDRWLTVFEEFSAIAPSVLEILNLGRSFGLCGVLGTQSFADLEACDPVNGSVFARRILGSVNSFLIHSLIDPDDAELAARLIGTEERVENTAQVVEGKFTGAASARRVRSFLMHPDELKSIPTGEAVFFSKADFSVRWIKVRNSGL